MKRAVAELVWLAVVSAAVVWFSRGVAIPWPWRALFGGVVGTTALLFWTVGGLIRTTDARLTSVVSNSIALLVETLPAETRATVKQRFAQLTRAEIEAFVKHARSK